MQKENIITGRLVNIEAGTITPSTITIDNGRIARIEAYAGNAENLAFITPGFIDSHVHIESSMLIPSEFARLAVVHGTVGTVSDPHEIANVCGVRGVEYMIDNGNTVPFKFNFGAPSCVPATIFETAGANVTVEEVTDLLKRPEIRYLSEMMNFPGVLNNDPEVMQKIAAAHKLGKPVDGHAPGLRGDTAKKYIDAGISTDHECFTAEEALDKLKYGMKILIREGSAAKNFEALAPLLHEYSKSMMFCSDDKHPDSLVAGHINQLCARAVAKGIDVYKVLRAACINPVEHYKLKVGLLREGDPADFLLVEDLNKFRILKTYIDGILVAENGNSLIIPPAKARAERINNFNCDLKTAEDFVINDTEVNYGLYSKNIIEALDGQLITNSISGNLIRENGKIDSNVNEDLLKIVVVNRYYDSPVAIGFIHNIGLKKGALASSVAHDSHNIVAVGVDDESIAAAVNLVIKAQGGVSCADGLRQKVVALPVAGLMSDEDGYKVADDYTAIDKMSKELGSTLGSPFMTLSFMALLVIPSLKLSDKGLFDGSSFRLIS
ncbi:MAG: adenine deaminase [Chitinophagaceae bacterium]|nr:MAG: adenine deaminase [Chitinophagaceae bacterium]